MSFVRAFLRSQRVFASVVAALLLVPLVFSSPASRRPLHLGFPRVYSGDEPHYLVYLNSLVRDGDLDFTNNYAAVHAGDRQAGALYRGAPLDHHSIWFRDGRKIKWWDFYFEHEWDRNARGRPVPKRIPGVDPRDAPTVERPWNVPGLPVLLSPFVWAVRGTTFLEPLAVLLCALATIFGMAVFRQLARHYSDEPIAINVATAVAFLATPVWHYARALFPEAFLVLFVTGAYACVLTRRRPWLAGAFIGLAFMLKPVSVLLFLPVFALLLRERVFRELSTMAACASPPVALTLVINAVTNGSPFRFPNEIITVDFWNGLVSMFASPSRGMLVLAPVLFVGLLGWPALLRRDARAATVLAAAVIYVLALSPLRDWGGAFCYATRYQIVLFPLICLGWLPPDAVWKRSRVAKAGVALVATYSFIVSFLAAVQYWRSWDHHPLAAWFG